jgi:hypothetical protein
LVQAGLGKKPGPIFEITRAKMAGDMAQAVQHLPQEQGPEFKPQCCQKRRKSIYIQKLWTTHLIPEEQSTAAEHMFLQYTP